MSPIKCEKFSYFALEFRLEALPEQVALVEEAPAQDDAADGQLDVGLHDVGPAVEPGVLEVVQDLLALLLVLLGVDLLDVSGAEHLLDQEVVELLDALARPEVP